MRRLVALALLVALVACTKVSNAPQAGGTSGSVRHPWTRPGVLRIVSLSDPDTLSPLVGVFQVEVDLSMFWAGYLFNYNDRNELVPELATTVPTLENGGISRDGRTIAYHLRKGVRWQDGAPFTAADVVFTWHAVMNPSNNVSSRIGYDDIARIDTPDPYTAIVHLKQPYSPFVNSFLTMSAQPYPVYPRHLLAKYHDLNRIPYNSAPVGTGPFIVREWHRGEIVRMIANPHYWRGAPKLREVDYQAIPDENTLLSTMQSHGADLWYNASATLYPQEKTIAGTRTLLTPFTQYSYIGFNNARPILRDVAVRRALALATDRKRLSETLAHGIPILADGDIPPFSWAYDRSLPSLPYDPARARAILDAGGWRAGSDGIRTKSGQRLRLEVATTTGNVVGNRLAILLQNAWRAIGVDLTIKPYASALMFASYGAGGILQTGKFDVQFSSWLNGVDPDDSSTTMCDQIPPNGSNAQRFCDPALDAQQRIALSHYDRAARKAAYAKIEHVLVDRVPFLTQWFARRIDVVSDDLQGYRPAHDVTTFWNPWQYSI